MEGKRLIKSIRLKNLLSFGSKDEEMELEPLNVLIGRNASGKSNLIEAIELLRATPKDFSVPIRQGGGISEWLWKGSKPNPVAEIKVEVEVDERTQPLRHKIFFTQVGQRLEIVEESIENDYIDKDGDVGTQPHYRYKDNQFELYSSAIKAINMKAIDTRAFLESLRLGKSILSQIKSPYQYPEIDYLTRSFETIKVYKQWDTGRNSVLRNPQKADLPNDFLWEDASNLGLVLNYLERKRAKKKIIEKLKDFYREAEDYFVNIEGGTVQVFIHEEGLSQPIPATRLSDGTLRYLCLLTILCHPSPPPLICIEEPELGLHPDVLHTVAKLLIEASQRTQLIVTTHSDILVDALSETPEAILVCERDIDGTHLRRLEREALKEWLEKYTLGELWRMGEIGAV